MNLSQREPTKLLGEVLRVFNGDQNRVRLFATWWRSADRDSRLCEKVKEISDYQQEDLCV